MGTHCGGSGPILIVDPQTASRASIARLLRQAGYGCRAVATGEEALEAAREQTPATVILAVVLPGISGYDVCRILRDEFGELLPIIFISGIRTNPVDRRAGLRLGADDYLVEPVDTDELLARVRRGLDRVNALRRREHGRSSSVGSDVNLTPRERQVLEALAHGQAQLMIAEQLRVSTHTVATHIQRVLIKLGAHSRAEAVALAYRAGLVGASDGGKHRRPPASSEPARAPAPPA